MRADETRDDIETSTTAGDARLLRSALGRLGLVSDAERAAQVSELERRLAVARLRVLLVGEAKRGKSTLGNALLGRDVLPTAVAPLTAVATTVRAGTPERVEVAFVDGSLVTSSLDDLAYFVTEPGNPVNYRGVADVTVFVDSEMPAPDMELVDTPGAGSVFDHNTTAADAALTRMDVAIIVLTADPPISSSERDLLRRTGDLSVRTLIVLNKVDRLTWSERREVEQFTADVVNGSVGGGDIRVFPCSAKSGLEARLRHDDDTWSRSGMQALADVLGTAIRDSGLADLVVSVAAAAQRVAEGLLDETTLTLRARQLLAQERSGQVARFVQRLDALGALRDEALAVARGEGLTQRRALDESAASSERQLSTTALITLNRALDEAGDVDTAQLEARGAAALGQFIRSQVDGWREQRAHEIDDALLRLSGRQQELLDSAVGELCDIARETLGVHLKGSADRVRLPDSTGFGYTLGPEAGWNEPLTSALRRHLPGTLGRRKVTAYLRCDAERLVAKHMGRARSDLQRRLEEAIRTLAASIDRTFTQHTERARAAVEAATITAAPVTSGDCCGTASDRTDGGSGVVPLEGRAAELADILACLQRIPSQRQANQRAHDGH